MKKLRVILSVIMALCLSIGIVACGKTKTATVTFDLGYEGATNFTQSVAVENSAVEPKDPAREGYEFGGWYTDGTFATAYEFAAKVDADKSVYAKWNKLNTVTYDLDDGEFDQYRQMSQTVATGSAFALHPAPQKDKAAFAGWKVGNQVYTPGSNVTLAADGDVTVEAVWTNQYTVTFVDYDGTEIDVQTINEGEAATAPEFAGTARPNYRFAEAWSVDFDEVDSDMTVTAVYAYVPSEDMFFSYAALKEGYLPAEDGDELIGYAVSANADNKATIPADLVLPREHNGMNVIGVVGFNGLTIKSVFIPNTIEVIGHQAFMSCTKLVDVAYEDGCKVEAIGDYAFGGENKDNLMTYTEIFIPASVKTIGNHAYGWCAADTVNKLTFEENSLLETIGDYAFGSETTGLAKNKIIDKIVIPASVKTIGDRAFYNVARNIQFEEGSVLETIGDYAFACKSALTSADKPNAEATRAVQAELVIPASVKTIGQAAFYYQGIKCIRFEEGTEITTIPAQFAESSDLTYIEMPSSVTTIGETAFKKSKIGEVVIPYTVKTISKGAFQETFSLASVVFEEAPAGATDAELVIGPDVFMGNQEGSSPNGYRINTISLKKLVIPAHCVEIGDRAFSYVELCELTVTGANVDSAKNTSKLAKIGEFAFAQIHPFKSNSSSVSAFNKTKDFFESNKPLNEVVGASQLAKVVIPASVKTFGPAIFAGNINLTSISLPKDMTEIPSGMFAFCPMLSVSTSAIPTTVTKIGGYAFAGYQNGKTSTLKVAHSKGATVNMVSTTSNTVKIAAGVTYIGPAAFAARSKLNITFEENATEGATLTLKENAFSMNVTGSSAPAIENTTQKKIAIPVQVKEIPANLFTGYSAITEYDLGTGVTEIPEGFLKNNTTITSYNVSAQITKIGKQAFMDSAITSITFAADSQLQVIGESAFDGVVGLTSFPFAETIKLHTIEKQAFMETSLASVEIPASVEYIGLKAFYDVHELATLSFAATPAENAVGLYIDQNAFGVSTTSVQNVASAKEESALTGTVQLPKRLAFMHPQAFYMVGLAAFTVEGDDVTKDSAYVARDGVLYHVTQRNGETNVIESDELISVPAGLVATSLTTGETTKGISYYAIVGTKNLETFVGANIKTFGIGYEYKLVDNVHTMIAKTTGITNVIAYNQVLTSATFPALTDVKTTGNAVYGNPELTGFEFVATATISGNYSFFGYNAKMKTIIIRSDYTGESSPFISNYGMGALETLVYLGAVGAKNQVIDDVAISNIKRIYLKDAAAVTAAATNASFKKQDSNIFEVYDYVSVATDPVNELTTATSTPVKVKISVSSAPVVENTFNGYFVVEFVYQPEGPGPVVTSGYDNETKIYGGVIEIKNGVVVEPEFTFYSEGEYTLSIKLYKDLAEGEDEYQSGALMKIIVASTAE